MQRYLRLWRFFLKPQIRALFRDAHTFLEADDYVMRADKGIPFQRNPYRVAAERYGEERQFFTPIIAIWKN